MPARTQVTRKVIESISTDGLKSVGKVEAWNQVYSGLLAAADFIPDEDDFSAGLMLGHVGRLGLARLATGRCTIRRTENHIDATVPQLYSFIIQANGKGSFVHRGNSAVLNPGDLTLCDHHLPHTRSLDQGAEILLIRVPAEIMADYLPRPDILCGRRLPAGAGLASSARALVRGLWRRLEEGQSPDYEECIAHHLLELIATSYAMVFGPAVGGGDVPDGRAMMIVQNYIEDRLHDPDFKSSAIARDLRMMPRDVHHLFASNGESVRSYLLRRRLEEAARRLRDPRWRGHTIAEVAHCCGFVSTAVFARTFRARYGVAPTDYRGAH